MNNNRGQTFALFVVLIPIFVICFAYIFDTGFIIYEKNNLQDLAFLARDYLEEGKTSLEVQDMIILNDSSVIVEQLSLDNIKLTRVIPSYFGRIIGYENYNIEINLEE